MTTHRVYRTLTLLYPRDFRRRYGDDLIQHHADLTIHYGASRAWSRTALDLLLTVPRYRLETIMNPNRSATALNLTIALLAIGGVAALLTGIYPGIALLGLATIIAVAQRSSLARAIRTPDTSRRHRRLAIAAILALASAAILAVAIVDLGGREEWGARAVVYNLTFLPCAIGAIVYLVIGLLTPKGSEPSASAGVLAS